MTAETGPSRQQVLEWAVCGIAAAGARFVPVPFLDDVVRDRATLLAVSRTVRAHGRTYDLDLVEPLTDPKGIRRGLMARLAGVPGKLLLFPVRKYVAIARLVRGGPADVLAVVLLGRSVDRALDRGLLAGPDPATLHRESVAVRRAFEDAEKNADLRLVAGALADGLVGVKELGRAAVETSRRLLDRDQGPKEREHTVTEAADTEGPVREGALRVEETLRRPEVVAELARFDATFDARLAHHLGGGAVTSPPV
ncbi:hypothetical protein [Kineosporia sp. A_224]|uniref:hypothetical protein n=1 Tax=Kineosporia sp. A_224 TaxID=1962180 RepID=UPI000B4AFD2D|nr:hypothetical protein [Kineosporia sp. A_224]